MTIRPETTGSRGIGFYSSKLRRNRRRGSSGDTAGEILDVNPCARQLFGYRCQELVGQRLREIEAARDTAGLRGVLGQTRDQRSARFSDMSFQTKDGGAIETEAIGDVCLYAGREPDTPPCGARTAVPYERIKVELLPRAGKK
jgi:PAS domain S-box-containing protein